MTSSTVKRVVLYRFDRQPLECIVNPGDYLRDRHVELITAGGTLQAVAFEELKAVCFVSGGGAPDLFRSYNLFERRPKVPGLWTRFTFRDGDRLDGVLSQNLLEWPAAGYLTTPPRAGSNRQRVFIPRAALAGTEVLGVVGKPGAIAHRKKPAEDLKQLNMFET